MTESGSIFVKMPEGPADLETSQEERRSLNYKLGLLIIIASCALVSIVLISQQLIVRHLAADQQPPPLQLGSPGLTAGLRQRLSYPGEGERQEVVVEMLLPGPDYFSSTTSPPLPVSSGQETETLEAEISELRSRKVKSLEAASWRRCGQQAGLNQVVSFQDGSQACARHREPHSQLVLGELMSFYLARLLGITSVPPVVLSRVEQDSPVWSSALQEVENSGWKYGSTVALIQWVGDLAGAEMPEVLRRALLDKQTLELGSGQLTVSQAGQLAQWSDLVVLDFLTANYDRLAALLDTAQREGRAQALAEKVPNLLTNPETGRLWLIDNEAGLLDGYSLLYPEYEEMEGEAERFQEVQRDLLHSLCVFKRSTVAAVFALYKSGDAATLLGQFIARNEPLYQEMLQHLPGNHGAWKQHFQQRIEEVWIWMKQCQESGGFSHL